ncbi:MAG: hypothetical protein J5958_06670 [Clostridia bacterium]|nr:hypothetical protein [Clostridia bacterium]
MNREKPNKLGERVNCSAYLKKVSDGVFIERVEKGQKWCGFIAKGEYFIPHGADWNTSPMPMPEDFDPFTASFYINNIPQELLSPCDGSDDVLKTYYKTITKEFKGYIVAIKDIVVEGYLGVDCSSDPYSGDHYFIFKRPKTVVKCAVVYYALGKSRLVPIANIEIDLPDEEVKHNEQ